MISYLPEIYRDELVYSWFCRYYVHSGCLTHKKALDDILYKRCNNPSKEFLGHLNPEMQKQIQEIIPLEHDMYKKIGVQVANRNELEYNGDFVRQLVVGALVYDEYLDCFALLKCKGERLKGKLTLIQGHMAFDEKATARTSLKTIMMRNLRKEISEELTLNPKDILQIEPLYLIQSNDNKISSEHLGMISFVKIDTSKLNYEIKSGEPDKHDLEYLEILDKETLEEVENANKNSIALIACRVDGVRLIDNIYF